MASTKSKWNEDFIIDTYNLAKSGMTENQIAGAIGISVHTLRVWEKKKKRFKSALERGRNEHIKKNGKTFTLQDYIFGRLSYKNRKLWKKLCKIDKNKAKAKDVQEQIEILLEKRGMYARQSMFMYAWMSFNFSISMAMRKVNISRPTFEKWKKDPEFHELFKEMVFHKKDFFESHLIKLVAGGNVPATIFANKTFNRDIGYNEKLDVDMNLTGELDQNVISIDTLNLTLEERIALRNSIKEKRIKDAKQINT
jgi:hypothetical protein